MFNDYWNPQQKGTQKDFVNNVTRTSDEWEQLHSENLRMQKAQMWEQARAEAGRGIGSSPRDWIKQWEMNQQRNPWVPTPRTEGEKMQSAFNQAKATAQKLEPLAKAYKALLSASESAEGEPLNITPDRKWQMESVVERFQATKKQAEAIEGVMRVEFGSATRQVGGGTSGGETQFTEGGANPEPPNFQGPSTPPTPSWLKDMYPQLGANITSQPIAPLSGQQWGAMPESQKQGWLGFAEFSGAIPMDLLSSMEQMLPNTPAGAGRTSWRPSRQRGSV
jgi:hypothetical protein